MDILWWNFFSIFSAKGFGLLVYVHFLSFFFLSSIGLYFATVFSIVVFNRLKVVTDSHWKITVTVWFHQEFNSGREQHVVTDSHCKMTVAVSVNSPLQNNGSSPILQTISTAGDDQAKTVEMTCGGATMMEPAVGYWSEEESQ